MTNDDFSSMSDEEIRQRLLKPAEEAARREAESQAPSKWDGVGEVVGGLLLGASGLGLVVAGIAAGWLIFAAVGMILAGANMLNNGLRRRAAATWWR